MRSAWLATDEQRAIALEWQLSASRESDLRAMRSISADLIAATRFALDSETVQAAWAMATGYVCTTLIPVVEGEISLLPG